MARFRVLHGSVKTADGFVAVGGFVELSESDAKAMGDLELVKPEAPSPELVKAATDAILETKPKGKTK